MKRLGLWSGGVTIYLLALIFTAPATLLDGALGSLTAGRVRLARAQGSVWAGQGLVEIRNKDVAGVLTKSLQWKLDKSQLLLLRFAWRLALDTEEPRSMVTVGLYGIQITGLDLVLPVPALAQALPLLAGYGLDGSMQLHIDTLRFGPDVTEGSATLQWHQASTVLAPVTPLGSYQLHLEGAGSDVIARLDTLQGPLVLHGSGRLGRDRRTEFTATADMPVTEYEKLAPFLRLIGVEQIDGSFKLHM